MLSRRLATYIYISLVIGILAVYGQMWNHGFINYDDTQYVTKNPWVQEGLTFENISRAFTATEAFNWHPLTWLSHMADCHFFGLNPGPHHLTSLLFHIVNTLLLFSVFRMMTGAVWQSAFVAALFALHPLHVESVAWLAERKDVLSAFFWLLTMWAYVRYTRRPGVGRYVPVVFFFGLGLMSKPMVVTLPFVLILLDIWPLGRLRWGEDRGHWFRLVLEKVPLLILSVASSVVTFLVQRGGGAVSSLDAIPLEARVANVLISYVGYLGKTVWPHKLAVFYPYPDAISLVHGLLAGTVLLFITVLVLRVIRRHPYCAVGWLWYLGTLVPVIGLVQVGSQSMADRYTYLPLVGIFVIIAWGVPTLLSRCNIPRWVLATLALIVLVVLMGITWVQAGYWKNNISLFRHALNVTDGNFLAHNNLGVALYERGDTQKAAIHYREALLIRPYYPEVFVNLGNAFARQGDTTNAIKQYLEALHIHYSNADAHSNLANCFKKEGKLERAKWHYIEALRINPQNGEIRRSLGIVLSRLGDMKGAVRQFIEAVRIDPGDAMAHYNLALAFSKLGNMGEAVREYRESLEIDPGNHKARYNLALALYAAGDYAGALKCFEEVIRREPALEARASYDIARAYARDGRVSESVQWLKRSVDGGFNDWDCIKTDADLNNIRGTTQYKTIMEGR